MMRILSVIGALFLGGAFFTSCTTSGRVSTFVVLPDTQTYLEQCPEVFDSQVDWLGSGPGYCNGYGNQP